MPSDAHQDAATAVIELPPELSVQACAGRHTEMDCFMALSLAPGGIEALSANSVGHAPWRLQRSISLPRALDRHLTTQDQLLRSLRQRAWADLKPRVMVDAGCHAGHGPDRNMSDMLLWLDIFSRDGAGLVVGIDAFEDFVLDLQYRLEHVPPYSSLTGFEKRAYTYAVSPTDGEARDLTSVARMHLSCCIDQGWCGTTYSGLERMRRSDHLCRISRMRLGLATDGARLKFLHDGGGFQVNASSVYRRYARVAAGIERPKTPPRETEIYHVPSMRLDTFWRRHVLGRRVDFWKVDVDKDWKGLGLAGLLRERAFAVATIEVDGKWGGVLEPWNVSSVDQFAWYARLHGYDSYMKVACPRRKHGSFEHRYDGKRSAWLLALAAGGYPFRPSGFHVHKHHGYEIQDLVVVDRREAATAKALVDGGRVDCMSPACANTACVDVVSGRGQRLLGGAGVRPRADDGAFEALVLACIECIRRDPV